MSREIYCEVVGKVAGLLKNKIEINVDFGESHGLLDTFLGNNSLKAEDGTPLQFNSIIDALNHMGKDKWKFVNAFSITFKDQNVYHYIMRKVVDDECTSP